MLNRSMRAAAPAAVALVLALVGTAVPPSASGTMPGSPGVAERAAAPALLSAVPARRLSAAPGAGDGSGTRRMVTLDRTVLPARAHGQRLSLPVGGSQATVRLTAVEHDRAYSAWGGTLEGTSLGSFNLVKADGVYRGMLTSPQGVYTLTRAHRGNYWWTAVPPRTGSMVDDAAAASGSHATAREAGEGQRFGSGQRRRTVKVGVMFGYTKGAKTELGGKAEVKAAAALVIAQTNEALANSGLDVKVKYRGLVKAKGTESTDAVKDAFRVSRPHDGRFDNLQRVRKRHGGDIVHLLASGDAASLCGGGLIPASRRQTTPAAGASVTFVACLPYLVATHELGHNLGADHVDYPGVSHFSKLNHSYGYYNVAGGYITMMSYYNPCTDAGVATCVRIPYFSSPTNTVGGQPLGFDEHTDNTLVIRKVAPAVSRYVR